MYTLEVNLNMRKDEKLK